MAQTIRRTKTSSKWMDNIEALLERLRSLQITNKVLEETCEQSDKKISITLALVIINNNEQTITPKNIVPDLGWFNRNQIKFEDWQRKIQLFLRSNRIMRTNNRITAILACLREDIAGIYAQKKLDELDKELGIQDWEEFIKEIKTMFSNKIKAADTKWRIESFKQGKKNIADFIIEFKALAMKADTNELYAIFLLKKNV